MFGRGYLWGLIAFFAIVTLFFSVRLVDTNETCAAVTLGRVSGVANTGVNLRWPWPITTFSCYDRQAAVYQTTKDAEGDADYLDYPVEIKTSDGQTALVEFNLTFHIQPKDAIFVRSSVANSMRSIVTRVVANFSRSIPRDLGAKYTASSLYGIGRVDYGNEIESELRVLLAKYGVTLDEFELRDINFDDAYETAIENQQIARENIETAQFQAQQAVYEAQRTAELAKGEANAAIERARGEAEALRINAAAEADAITLRGEALRKNPEVLKLYFIDALRTANWIAIPWNDILPFLPLDVPTPQ